MAEQNVRCRISSIYERAKNVTLNLLFMVHLVPTTLGMQGCWSPDSYLFYNLLFFLILLWCIQNKESEEPVVLALVVNALAILFDVIVLSIYFPGLHYSRSCGGVDASERFSVAMAILNLVVRLYSCSVLHNQWNDRSAVSAGFNFNDPKFPKPSLKILSIDNIVRDSGDDFKSTPPPSS